MANAPWCQCNTGILPLEFCIVQFVIGYLKSMSMYVKNIQKQKPHFSVCSFTIDGQASCSLYKTKDYNMFLRNCFRTSPPAKYYQS